MTLQENINRLCFRAICLKKNIIGLICVLQKKFREDFDEQEKKAYNNLMHELKDLKNYYSLQNIDDAFKDIENKFNYASKVKNAPKNLERDYCLKIINIYNSLKELSEKQLNYYKELIKNF